MTPGRTQAVDSVANICGRRRSGRLRPIATYAIGGHGPGAEALDEARADEHLHRRREAADDQADREQADAGRERSAEPAPVDEPADEHDPDQRAEHERGEDPAVKLDAVQLVGRRSA